MRSIGSEITQFWHVDKLVVDHRRSRDDPIAGHTTDLGEAVSVVQIDVETGFDELTHIGGQWGRPDDTADDATAVSGAAPPRP
ncbi:hypothetical protein WN67_06660 [Mycolicibacterium obuense]|uniref:Uncharacterized protein n=1 Tax=Mycolicibacterium obuense TaxID=1807 RepID=A0A0M2K6C1_9MYCO|nr:hypothetical protein WN67_06660 [Mycolicibacterium obuense]